MDLYLLEKRVIDLIQKVERLLVNQENAQSNYDRQMYRIESIEAKVTELDLRVASVQEATAELHELTANLQGTYKSLHKLAVSMGILLLTTSVLLTLVGAEAFPYIMKIVGVIL